ncbi:MAG: thiamine phosphate synthase [Blastocatellia bacterium]
MKSLIQNRRKPLLYLITDRLTLPRKTGLIDFIERAIFAGVDIVQIRERDLSARDLLLIADSVREPARKAGAHLLVNDRADVAACSGAGVHLTTRSMSPDIVRGAFDKEMLIGASTHNLEEAQAAWRAGADFIVFGPVFETESKKQYGPPVGLDALRMVAGIVKIPVLALGGINQYNFREALDAGASGIAGISLFSQSGDIENLVREIKSISAA